MFHRTPCPEQRAPWHPYQAGTSAKQYLCRTIASLVALLVFGSYRAELLAESSWPPTGQYVFNGWEGPPLTVYFGVPPGADSQTPILIVIPGAKRNAKQYRDEWDHLAVANHFVTLVIKATKQDFPTEYEYNLGGVTDSGGNMLPRNQWLFSAIDPLFSDFKRQFGSTRETYSLYGHSAGGGFVHLFLLLTPEAKVDKAVAANPAFCTMPDSSTDFPFGLRGLSLPDDAVRRWFARPLTVMLGDRDLAPRAQPLSNGPEARQQGPHVFARGLGFYQKSLSAANSQDLPLHWRLEVVPDVGHDNAHMASRAVKHLFGQ